jgi:hypothetical protein
MVLSLTGTEDKHNVLNSGYPIVGLKFEFVASE